MKVEIVDHQHPDHLMGRCRIGVRSFEMKGEVKVYTSGIFYASGGDCETARQGIEDAFNPDPAKGLHIVPSSGKKRKGKHVNDPAARPPDLHRGPTGEVVSL